MALILAVCLLGGVSFGLGRLSVATKSHDAPLLCSSIPSSIPGGPATVAQTATVVNATGQSTPPGRQQGESAVPAKSSYVASKNGSVYHLPWCSGAKRIKEANKVWFDTKARAEAAGYKPASNCKGM